MSLPWNRQFTLHAGEGALQPQASQLLEEAAASLGRKAAVQMVLANTHFHFDLVHGDYRGNSDRQLQSIAQACVLEILGDDGIDRQIRWQLQPDGQHLLICAIASDDIALLNDAATRNGLQLASIQPELCAQWNAHAGVLQHGTGVFAVAGDSDGDDGSDRRVVVALAQRRSITALSCGVCPDSSALDNRTDRLLSGAGWESSAPWLFALIAGNPRETLTSQRWVVLPATGGPL